MNPIVEYQAVSESGDVKKLNEEVMKLINQGYQPFGSVATAVDNDTVYFTQVLVRYGSPRSSAQ